MNENVRLQIFRWIIALSGPIYAVYRFAMNIALFNVPEDAGYDYFISNKILLDGWSVDRNMVYFAYIVIILISALIALINLKIKIPFFRNAFKILLPGAIIGFILVTFSFTIWVNLRTVF